MAEQLSKRICLTALALMAMGAGPLAAAELRVEVEGVAGSTGNVMAALHAPAEGVAFPDMAGAIAAQWHVAKEGAMAFVFSDLAPGAYAVAVFHDENADGVLDANLLGVPTEGFGFSNGAQASFGPPPFSEAAVTVGEDGAVTNVKLTY